MPPSSADLGILAVIEVDRGSLQPSWRKHKHLHGPWAATTDASGYSPAGCPFLVLFSKKSVRTSNLKA